MKLPTRSGRLAISLALALLGMSGCRARDNDPGPGGVTVGEARALDEAAKMLESRQAKPATASPMPKAAAATTP